MADNDLFDRRTLQYAQAGLIEYESDLEQLQRGRRADVGLIVGYLRRLPAEDFAKKRELAKFFQTRDGQVFSTQERRAAYDELLGRNRNRRTFG